ncbi:MAG: DegT/DnrJ/EryC1/StrS family aminotransferase [Candidatus Omnitrophica bacterium]|nr:DegT/DnrJ/EryC1/StrS family aminotransferase [Candidatus Omnitrophota bacterium]
MNIPHSRPTISSRDHKSVQKVLLSSFIAQGRELCEFERKFSQYVDVKDAVAVSSGTAALHLALAALDIKQDDEVIIPSYVCTALLNACLYVGARPRLADVNPEDGNICAADVKKRLTRRTKAIIVPHMFGLPADLKPLLKLGVPIIEDCAQAIGAEYNGKKVGSWGIISICSFYATKVLTTGEGGMLLSNHRKYLDRARDLRSYDHCLSYQVRFNYKMTNIQAALGLSQLQQLPHFIKRRQLIAGRYNQAFKDLNFRVPPVFPGREHIFYRYVIRMKSPAAKMMSRLRKNGVDASSPVFKPVHVYLKQRGFPVTEDLMAKTISLPIYPTLAENQIQKIITTLHAQSGTV